MQQLITMWNALDLRRKIFIAGATFAIFAAILGLSRMATTPSMDLLYAGLEPVAAGEVITALEQRNAAYEVRGSSIFVETGRRDELRMTLASEGLPANGTQGYELLDSLSGFGTTSQMFDAAYWRAKEGELARTILASPAVSSARVHIANAGSNPFQRDLKPSASLSITSGGAALGAAQARAFRYLIASAVPGLQPDDVAVIDGQGKLVAGDDELNSSKTAEDKGEMLRSRVQRLVEARVGQGNAVVEVSVDTVTESELITERHFDPESRVVISTDSEEVSTEEEDQGGGNVTVASNLPDGEAGGNDSSKSRNSETRERVNYEVSETRREITRVPGAVKRLTVAVLVNGTISTDANGNQVFAPLPEAEIEALRALVASAVGYEESRGDDITIRSMAFEPRNVIGTEALPQRWINWDLQPMRLVQMAVLAIVALILGLFVVRPVLSRPVPNALPAPDAATAQDASMTALTGEIEDGNGDFGSMKLVERNPAESIESHATGDDPVDRLRGLIAERREETVEVLRTWLDEKEPAT
ncbi:flagellar basal-body MS-ring/collar protein FliF [Primorskyibacter flagellatus]|uniref:Flagellar M-ring protein n=1 Tax=Primorskyibacter flagellatus TaxID=1387277 RepID=A0A1W2BXF8_9RHOB|nr:flagellar basal-body MS-ring/collar protein FliF [Primorskyibacter flagellatus]SMC77619.1 flagellar M-ring protein FliF [Primorskyibacter flagellatus]